MTKTIRAIIVEDEPNARFVLSTMISTYLPEVEIVSKCANVREGIVEIEKQKPELIFLDIQLTDGTGFDLLNQIDEFNAAIIFTTAFDDYAIKAIKFNAFDYLLKPIDHIELKKCVERYRSIEARQGFNKVFNNYRENIKMSKSSHHRIVIPNGDKKSFIPIIDIVKCIAEKSYTWICLSDGTKMISSKNLGEFERVLPSSEEFEEFFFIRVHHGTIVNSKFIKEFQKSELKLTMFDGDVIKVSHRKKSQLNKVLSKFVIN